MNDMNGKLELIRTGRVWKFGDQINTDLIMPTEAMRVAVKERGKFAFAASRPGWAALVKEGDLLVAGHNFGLGSGRPVGSVLRGCGIGGLIAESINGLCLRNCVNFSLPGMDCPGITGAFDEGDMAWVNFLSGEIRNLTKGTTLHGRSLEPLLANIVSAGGVLAMLINEDYIEDHPTNPAAD